MGLAWARPGEDSDGKVKVNLNFDSAMRRISFQRKAYTFLFRTLPSIFKKITAKYDCSKSVCNLEPCTILLLIRSLKLVGEILNRRSASKGAWSSKVLWIGHSSIYLRVASTLGSRCYFQYARSGWKDNTVKSIRRLQLSLVEDGPVFSL